MHRFYTFTDIKVPSIKFFVPIGDCVGVNDEILTLAINAESRNTPLVLLHGFAGGIAFWVKNLEDLSADRPLYAIDLLGFGRSSRPKFSKSASEIEQQFVESIERWRDRMMLPKMILLGHSFGGFLASSYALQYPERIEHLILCDPWGFTANLDHVRFCKRLVVKIWQKMVRAASLALIRAAGPCGEWLFRKVRRDILEKFQDVVDDPTIIGQYFCQCNSNRNATGEKAFSKLGGLYAKHPIGEKVKDEIKDDIPITFLYGADSWMDNSYGAAVVEARPSSYTNIVTIPLAGHIVFSDNPSVFNESVKDACKILRSRAVRLKQLSSILLMFQIDRFIN